MLLTFNEVMNYGMKPNRLTDTELSYFPEIEEIFKQIPSLARRNANITALGRWSIFSISAFIPWCFTLHI